MDPESKVLLPEIDPYAGLGASQGMSSVGASWYSTRGDRPPLCCASTHPKGVDNMEEEELLLRVRAPFLRDRPRVSVPPVVEICVVPQALLAAHSGQVLA